MHTNKIQKWAMSQFQRDMFYILIERSVPGGMRIIEIYFSWRRRYRKELSIFKYSFEYLYKIILHSNTSSIHLCIQLVDKLVYYDTGIYLK